MSFNQKVAKSYAGGAVVSFLAPLASFKGSTIPLNGVAAGSIVSTPGLVITCGSPAFAIEWSSLSAVIQTSIMTAGLTAQTVWQVSQDSVNWISLTGLNAAANATYAPAGTGASVPTSYVQAANAINPSFPYMRVAVVVGGATGGVNDTVTIGYNYRKRTAL